MLRSALSAGLTAADGTAAWARMVVDDFAHLGRTLDGDDPDAWDPDYIRRTLPLWRTGLGLYFRSEVRGLHNIPAAGPSLLVGNHSGGNLTPDSHVFTLAFATYFGVERRFHQLAHNLVLAMPGLGILRKFGTVAASHANAHKALES